jgi:glycosyltransferase involved in cell wall biosynthesis
MKILIFNWRCWENPLAGGAEKYLYEISKRLSKRGHEIIWFVSSFKGAKERESEDGIKIIRKGNKFSVYLYAFLYYLMELRRLKFDIVIDDVNGIPFFTPLFVRKPKKICVIHHLVGWKIFSKELKFYQAIVAWIAEKSISLFYFNIPVITVSKSSKDELKKRFLRNVSIVHNGIDLSLFTANRTKSETPVIAYLGRWKSYKRLDLLISAFEILKREMKNVELWLAGDGEWRTNKTIKGMRNFGKVRDHVKRYILSKSWVFVSTSMKEGWGITIIEANACGTPCIAYDVPGLRDSIVDGKTGILVKEDGNIERLTESIMKVLTDKKLRETLSKNAIEWSRNFDWGKSTENFEEVIKNV